MKIDPVTFTDDQKAALLVLVKFWLATARQAEQLAQECPTATEKKLMQRRDSHFRYCAEELLRVVSGGAVNIPDTEEADRMATAQKIQELEALVSKWGKIVTKKFEDARHEETEFGKRFVTHGAVCYFNCAADLNSTIKAWDGAKDLGLQVLPKDTERPRRARLYDILLRLLPKRVTHD